MMLRRSLRVLSLTVGCLAAARAGAGDGAAAALGEPRLDFTEPRHVRAVHLDLLGRSPTPEEAAMAAASRPEVLVRRLVGSRDFWRHWVDEQLYYFRLFDDFRPDAAQTDALAADLAAGRLDALAALRALVTSSAFNRRNPGNDTFVSVVLEQLLGLEVQSSTAVLESGKRMYDGRSARLFGADGDSQSDVVAIVTSQPGFAAHFAAREHRRLVGRDPGRDEVEAWGALLLERPGDYTGLVRAWMLSQAYAARLAELRNKSDTQFIRALLVDLTGVVPAEDDAYRRMRSALGALGDAGPLRSVLARALLEQHREQLPRRGAIDPEAWIPAAFVRFLGREPSAEELQDFLVVYRQQECEPATIVLSLVTHWEYQRY